MSHSVPLDVVVRCRNEMPYTAATLDMLARQQGVKARTLFIDSGSTDGSREAAAERGCEVIDLQPSDYVPGRVLNMAMQCTESDVVAFVNADAVPGDASALYRLSQPLMGHEPVAAAYARQLARPGADRLTRTDYERSFGPSTALQVRRGSFFSMAASAISRKVWERLPFDADLAYSEDVDWVNRAIALGWTQVYVPGARFQHSHDYTAAQHFRRRFGEGSADSRIYRLAAPALVDDLFRPLAGSLLRDLKAGIVSPRSVGVRLAQAGGYFAGRREAAAGRSE